MSYIDCHGWERGEFECDLEFLGFLILENKLKEATLPTIRTLNDCNVRTIMATGDNTLTAISVGRNCGMLNQDQDVYLGDVNEYGVSWQLVKAGAEVGEDAPCEQADPSQVPWENERG